MDIELVLQQRGLVSEDQWREARAQAGGRRIDSVLVEMGLLSEEQALEAFADELGMEFIELGDFKVDAELIAEFPTAAIFRHEVLPLDRVNGSVRVATSDPFDLEALSELSSLSGLELDPVLARHEDIVELIKANLGVGATRSPSWSSGRPTTVSNCSRASTTSTATWPRRPRRRR